MEAVVASKPPRRWSKRRLVLVVSSLIVAVVVLVAGVVAVARSMGFTLHAVDAVGDVGQIAPERGGLTSKPVTPASEPTLREPPQALPGAAPVVTNSTGGANASGQSGGPNASADAESAALVGVAGNSEASGGSSGAANLGGSGGSAGTANASPTAWESFVQGALALVGQSTIAMCGPNTCNVGQVCCNASCGTCVAPGTTCDQTPCAGAPRTPTVALCGRAQCNDGQICCNPSCGICVAPGETCSDEPCR